MIISSSGVSRGAGGPGPKAAPSGGGKLLMKN